MLMLLYNCLLGLTNRRGGGRVLCSSVQCVDCRCPMACSKEVHSSCLGLCLKATKAVYLVAMFCPKETRKVCSGCQKFALWRGMFLFTTVSP